MDIKIKIKEDRKCEPSSIAIGYVGERNIDRLVLEVDESIPSMDWFLLLNNELFKFSHNVLNINERHTSKNGIFEAYILGSNALPGNRIDSGTLFFNSEKIYLKVKERSSRKWN